MVLAGFQKQILETFYMIKFLQKHFLHLFSVPIRKYFYAGSWLFFLLFLLPLALQANEFKVLSFRKVPNDISAIQNKYKRYDDNDMLCAIIKVRSDVPNLRFSASNPVVGNVERRQGEYWVYLSEGTRQLYVFTEGFIKLSYTFPMRIEKGTVYLLEITSVDPLGIDRGKGSLDFTSEPDSVKVTIDGFPDLVKYTPCSFKNYRTGSYKFMFRYQRYQPLDTIIHIDRNKEKNIFIRLTPKWGNLVVTSQDTLSYRFQINGKEYVGRKLELLGERQGLDAGDYLLRISHNHYYDTAFTVHLVPYDTVFYTIGLKPVLTNLRVYSAPPGASVFLDGSYLGKTPLQKQVITGKHHLHIELRNFADEDREITLIKGQEKIVDLVMVRHVPVQITSLPDDASVYVNGIFKGKTPLTLQMAPRKVLLTMKKDLYQPQEDSIVIRKARQLHFTLHKQKYNLSVVTLPSGAQIYINGERVGITPENFSLPFGNYKVHVEKRGYISKNRSVNLKHDQKISFSLRKKLNGYISATFTFPDNEYEMLKIGGEIGWTYKSAPFFMTALGYTYGYTDDIIGNLSDVKSVYVYSYPGLSVHALKTDGFAEEEVNIFYLKAGLVIPKPFIMVFSATLGVYHQSGYPVYVSDDSYSSALGPDLYPGEKFIDLNGQETRYTPLYGFGYQMKISTFYFFGDYWISNSFNQRGSRWVLGLGLAF